MSGILLVLALSGCGGPSALAPLAPPEVDLVARVSQAHVDKDQPVQLEIRGTASEGWTLQPGAVSAEGLTVTPTAQEGPVQTGDQQVWTWRYELSGPPGSYVVEPGGGSASGPGDQRRDIETPPLFVDIGVTGPTGGPMADVEAPPPPEPPPWGLIAAGGALALAALGAGIWWRRRARAPVPPPPPEPPHVLASRAWERARLSDLDDHALALELSRVLRVYVEAITGFPATARTSREILRALESEVRLEPSLRVRAGHILDATDRLKFAREGGGEAFFKSLDEDFLAVIEATRPADPAPPAPPDADGSARA